MIKELKDFLLKGNVLDLAVAVVMGVAFNAIITSLVSDIITPLILNPVVKAANVENLSKLSWNGIAYGSFLSAVINFIIVGTTLFFVVKGANHATALGKKEEGLLKRMRHHHKKNCLLKSAIFLQTNNHYLFT